MYVVDCYVQTIILKLSFIYIHPFNTHISDIDHFIQIETPPSSELSYFINSLISSTPTTTDKQTVYNMNNTLSNSLQHITDSQWHSTIIQYITTQ